MRLVTPFLIAPPQIGQTNIIVGVEQINIILHKCVDVVRLGNHLCRTISGISIYAKLTIHLTTMPCDAAEFEFDPFHALKIVIRRQRLSSWININEPSGDSRFGVRDLHWFVCSHEQHRLHRNGVLLYPFLIDDNLLMRRNLVKQGVVPHMAEITIHLDTDKW